MSVPKISIMRLPGNPRAYYAIEDFQVFNCVQVEAFGETSPKDLDDLIKLLLNRYAGEDVCLGCAGFEEYFAGVDVATIQIDIGRPHLRIPKALAAVKNWPVTRCYSPPWWTPLPRPERLTGSDLECSDSDTFIDAQTFDRAYRAFCEKELAAGRGRGLEMRPPRRMGAFRAGRIG